MGGSVVERSAPPLLARLLMKAPLAHEPAHRGVGWQGAKGEVLLDPDDEVIVVKLIGP
jgi:hypothetical protein